MKYSPLQADVKNLVKSALKDYGCENSFSESFTVDGLCLTVSVSGGILDIVAKDDKVHVPHHRHYSPDSVYRFVIGRLVRDLPHSQPGTLLDMGPDPCGYKVDL